MLKYKYNRNGPYKLELQFAENPCFCKGNWG